MQLFRKYLLIISFLFSFNSLFAQNDTENLVQILQTASFNNLLPYWGQQVEVNIIQQINQKQLNASVANEQLQAFFNKQNIVGFEKTAERKLGNTIYITGKLLSSQNKYSLTLLLEVTKKGIEILSVRIS
ncbi:MAG: hypothetical protein RLY15_268 [Bacteroidota bacterium]|jgi:hypothetical protein